MGCIHLDNIVIRKVKEKKGTFKLSSSNRTGSKNSRGLKSQRVDYYLAAENDDEAELWIGAITASAEKSTISVRNTLRPTRSSKKKKGPSDEDGDGEPTPYFGVPLAEICEREGTAIPQLVELAVDELIQRGNGREISPPPLIFSSFLTNNLQP